MKSFNASANIKASPERIWSILTDAPNYPEWDLGIVKIEGKIALGEKITAYSKLSPDRAFPVRVTTFEPGRRMVWTGGAPFGLFKGIRTFALAPRGDGSVDFSLNEEFSGPMLSLVGRRIPDLTRTFEEFVAGLKAYAESAS
jgi:hypothetical protein